MLRWNLPMLSNVSGPSVVWEPIADRDGSNVAESAIVWTGDYDVVIVDISNAKPVTDGVNPRVQLSGDGGATWDGGASDYFNRGHFWHIDQRTQGNAQAYLELTRFNVSQGNLANEWCFVRLMLARPLDPNSKTQVIGWGGYGGTIPDYHTSMFFMQRDTAKRTDGLRFYYSSGNISEARIVAAGLNLS